MNVAIIGSRNCKGLTLETVLKNIPKETTAIISGGAIGADTFAREAAMLLNLPFEEILPDYNTFGKIAPLVRNKTIVDHADMVMAFWDYQSRGTRSALLETLKQDKKIKIILIDDGSVVEERFNLD